MRHDPKWLRTFSVDSLNDVIILKWNYYTFSNIYRIIPNRSTGYLDKRPEGAYIRFREPGSTVTNMIYKRNRPSKLGGASIRRGAFTGDNTVLVSGIITISVDF